MSSTIASYESIRRPSQSSVLLAVFIFVFTLWPFYIDIRLGENIGINPQRILIALITGVFFVGLFIDRTIKYEIVRVAKSNKILFLFIFTYLFSRVFSALVNGSAYSLYIVAYEILANFVLFFFALMYVRTPRDIEYVIVAIVTCAFLLSIYGIFEKVFEYNPLPFVTDTNSKALAVAQSEKIRNDVYRIQATFEHPLSLVQFLVLAFPFALFYIRIAERVFLPTLMAVLIALAIVFTDSRGGLIAIAVTFAIAAYFKISATSNRERRLIVKLAFAVISVPALLLLIFLMTFSSSNQSSTNTRAIQLYNGWIAVKQKPLFGYGPGNAGETIYSLSESDSSAKKIWRQTVDNLFISKSLESGLLAVLSFIALLINPLIRLSSATFESIRHREHKQSGYYVAFISSISSVVLMMLVLSIFTSLPIFFVVFGLAVKLTTLIKENTELNSDASRND